MTGQQWVEAVTRARANVNAALDAAAAAIAEDARIRRSVEPTEPIALEWEILGVLLRKLELKGVHVEQMSMPVVLEELVEEAGLLDIESTAADPAIVTRSRGALP